MTTEAADNPTTTIVALTSEGGASFDVQLTKPSNGAGPGIILLSDAEDVKFIGDFGTYLAEDGYVVLSAAPGELGLEAIRPGLIELSHHLEKDAPIGAIGIGRGGAQALEATVECGLDVVISYWPDIDPQIIGGLRDLKAPAVIHLVEAAPADLSAIGPDTRVHLYPQCEAGFALSGHPNHDKWPARIAYSRTLAPLRRVLGPHHDLAGLFADHLKYEFETKDADATMDTMVDAPYVNHIPTRTGGVGHDMLKRFYKYHFIPQQPDDRNNVLLSETVGADTVVLESLNRFTHTKEFDHMLPGIPPTGKYVELPVVVIAKFRGDRLYHEHIYWDHASLLAQLGLIDPEGLPISGIEEAQKLMDETLPSNELMEKWVESEGKPI